MVENSKFYNYFRDIVAIIEQKYPVIGFSNIKTAEDAFVGEIFFVNGVLFGSFFQNDFLSIPIEEAANSIMERIDETNLFHSPKQDEPQIEKVKSSKQKYYRLARNIAYHLSVLAESPDQNPVARSVVNWVVESSELSAEGYIFLEKDLRVLLPSLFPHDLRGKRLKDFVEWVYLAIKDHWLF